ncbi:hypothetical protein ACFYM2_08695 [Streptomyces sp. NPDC006711]|uniref:hypothetical protein n=1 Tax=Streptomyces sp. NPDC006711 TaxID=3364762 RepID=UPI0036B8F27B
MRTKGRGTAAVAWGVIALLFVGATVGVGALGLVRLGLAGDEVRVRLTHCRLTGGGRGDSHLECSGRLLGDVRAGSVMVRYDGRQGEVVPAARTPWGTFEVLDRSLTSWGTAVLSPLLPLTAAALTACLAWRSARQDARRAGRSAAWGR